LYPLVTGDRVAAAQSNGLCSILRVGRKPDGKFLWKEESVLAGHGGIVSNVDWSLDGRLILTTSADRTARIWSVSGGILRLVISSTRGGSANGLGETISKLNSKGKSSNVSSDFADHVQFGKFHLEDNFFHLTCRNEIYFYKYKIDLHANVLQRCHVVASCNRIAKFEFDNCTRLTAVSSTNLFYSCNIICCYVFLPDLLLAAGSDHSLNVLDINKKIIVRNIPVVHDATVTGIAINQGSLYSSFTGGSALEGDCCGCDGSYSLFATVAPGDSVRLWDLRVARGHVAELARCRIISGGGVSGGSVRDAAIPPVTLTFSPCGKYVCFGALSSHKTTSSQYLSPTVVDIRRVCSPLAQLNFPNKRAGPSNAATVVAWNPLLPEITTGSLDGRLSVYG
uniref:WD_REPEATS_REGION domain-containing protein n=1 Tax=Rodentolepis nana TaxID=102285 RepID=A0A0R3TEZ3_RODNA